MPGQATLPNVPAWWGFPSYKEPQKGECCIQGLEGKRHTSEHIEGLRSPIWVQAVLKCTQKFKLCQGLDPFPVWGRRQEEGDKLKTRLREALIIGAKLGEQGWYVLKLKLRSLHAVN